MLLSDVAFNGLVVSSGCLGGKSCGCSGATTPSPPGGDPTVARSIHSLYPFYTGAKKWLCKQAVYSPRKELANKEEFYG